MRRKTKFDLTQSLTKSGLRIGGGIVAKAVYNKVMPDMNPKLKAGALLGISIIAPTFVKNEMVSDLADGMGVVAGVSLAGAFIPALAGFEEDDILNGIGYDDDDEYDLMDGIYDDDDDDDEDDDTLQ